MKLDYTTVQERIGAPSRAQTVRWVIASVGALALFVAHLWASQ